MRKKSVYVKNRLAAAFLSGAMLLSLLPSIPAKAATVIGTLNGREYTNFKNLRSDLEDDYEGKTVVIEMRTDWDADKDSKYNNRLIIPSNCHATLNMHGNVFDRCLSSKKSGWEFNGELITMESGSSLTINGGTEKTGHSEPVYNTKEADSKADKMVTFYGGVLTGGSSTNGSGGIHMKDNCNLTLNDVTLAGCRAEVPWYDSAATRSGYGAGIWIKGGGSNVTLNNSTITGCHAQEDGGGIFGSNHNKMTVTLNNSHVDYNYSRSDGGGIDLDGEYLTLKGDGKSTVNGNQTNGNGGGIYIWNDDVTVSGLIVNNNSAKKGGGIYSTEEDIVLADLEIKNNTASDKGGGLYIENDINTLSNCVITGNKKYGVYVEDDVDKDFKITGKTVIKDNTDGNLTLDDIGDIVDFSLSRGADIHMGYVNPPSAGDKGFYRFSPVGSSDWRQFLTSDSSDYVITYSYNENEYTGRSLYYVKKGYEKDYTGYPIEKVEEVKLSVAEAAPSVCGRVDSEGNKKENGEYALIRGFAHHESTSENSDPDMVFYYSDGLFFSDPSKYNDHLATASLSFAFAGMYLREGGADLDSYKYKHAGARQFMADIGCPDQNIYVNDYNVEKPGTDTIGVTIAGKKLQKYNGDVLVDTEYTLIPVVVRGGGYESEWASNMTLGQGLSRDGEAQGFSEAADEVFKSIEYYISKYNLQKELDAGKVRFWITGYSRAGATANITSKRIIEKYCYDKNGKSLGNQVFAYTCEAPQGGTDLGEKLSDKTCYYSIHNMVNASDIVPLVGPVEMGFKRYGVDHYIPGTAAGKVTSVDRLKGHRTPRTGSSGIKSVTVYSDNNVLLSKINSYVTPAVAFREYDKRRDKMLTYLWTVDNTFAYNDFFQTQGFRFVPLTYGKSGNYAGSYREYFIDDFISFFLQSSLYSRDTWATEKLTLGDNTYGTFQQAMRETAKTAFTLSDENTAGMAERMADITDKMHSLTFSSSVSIRDLYDDVLGDWHTLSDKEKLKYINYFWDLIDDTGAFDYLTPSDKAKLEKNWPVLANVIFNYTDGDWDAEIGKDYRYPSGQAWVKGDPGTYMMYSMTMAEFIGSILSNHYPEVNVAWARTYDNWYDNEADKKYYSVGWGEDYSVSSPDALIDGQEGILIPDDKDTNRIVGDFKVILEVGKVGDAAAEDNVIGEAIYYDLENVTNGEDNPIVLNSNEIYRGGIDIKTSNLASMRLKLTTYARSYDVNSEKRVYYINTVNDRHQINVITKEDSEGTVVETERSYIYREGDKATVTATIPESMIFEKWIATDGDGKDVSSLIFENGDEYKKSFTFTLPEPLLGGLTEGYALKFTAQYRDKVSDIFVDVASPVSGSPLADTAVIRWGESESEKEAFPIVWTYEDEGEIVPIEKDNNIAYKNTVYTAKLQVLESEEKFRLFAPTVTGTPEGASAASMESVNVIRNSSDGSITVTVVFAATGDEGDDKPETDTLLTVNTLDLNSGAPDPEVPKVDYKVVRGTAVTISAPEVPNETFVKWDMGESGIEIIDSELTDKTITVSVPEEETEEAYNIIAQYMPVLNEIRATVEEPVIGEEFATSATVTLQVTNLYEIDPEFIKVSWNPMPESGVAEHVTPYTATVSIVPKTDEEGTYIKIRPSGDTGEYVRVSAVFTAAVNAKALINGNSAVYDVEEKSFSYTFDPIKYTVKGVKPVDNVEGLDHGSQQEQVAAALPSETKIVLDDGSEMNAGIQWGEPVKVSEEDPLDAAEWKAEGVVVLPELVDNPDEVDLNVSVKVLVNEAETVGSPRASLPSGEYVADRIVTLTSRTEGATVYYTIDGSDPRESGKIYEGEEIFVERDSKYTVDGKYTIRAIAFKAGMRDSIESLYEYEFVNTMDVPKGYDLVYNFDEQIGVDSGAFYTLKTLTKGASIDEYGNAVATNAGTYTVRATAAKDFSWKTDPVYNLTSDTVADPDKDYYQKVERDKRVEYDKVSPKEGDNPKENGWYEKIDTTTDDQIIKFTIAKLDITDTANVKCRKKYTYSSEFENDLRIIVREHQLDKSDYNITYNKKSTGDTTAVITGIGNFKGTVKVEIYVENFRQVTVHRLYNPRSGEHFYTKSDDEKASLMKLGWKSEGRGWYAPGKSKTPVYRMYNPYVGDHHFTVSTAEKNNLMKKGWKYEGIGWYSDDEKRVPVYRLYNPKAVTGTHSFTISKKEKDILVKAGWKYEGIAWYAIR